MLANDRFSMVTFCIVLIGYIPKKGEGKGEEERGTREGGRGRERVEEGGREGEHRREGEEEEREEDEEGKKRREGGREGEGRLTEREEREEEKGERKGFSCWQQQLEPLNSMDRHKRGEGAQASEREPIKRGSRIDGIIPNCLVRGIPSLYRQRIGMILANKIALEGEKEKEREEERGRERGGRCGGRPADLRALSSGGGGLHLSSFLQNRDPREGGREGRGGAFKLESF